MILVRKKIFEAGSYFLFLNSIIKILQMQRNILKNYFTTGSRNSVRGKKSLLNKERILRVLRSCEEGYCEGNKRINCRNTL